MADAYGGIVVSHDDEFVADMEALCAELNKFGPWTNSFGEFALLDGPWGRRIWFNDTHPQYPTLTPTRITAIVLENVETGETTRVFADQAAEEEWDEACAEAWDHEDAEIPLEEIASCISKHIQSGTISLACCSNEKNRSVASEMLTVRADGSAERIYIGASFMGSSVSREEVPPKVAV